MGVRRSYAFASQSWTSTRLRRRDEARRSTDASLPKPDPRVAAGSGRTLHSPRKAGVQAHLALHVTVVGVDRVASKGRVSSVNRCFSPEAGPHVAAGSGRTFHNPRRVGVQAHRSLHVTVVDVDRSLVNHVDVSLLCATSNSAGSPLRMLSERRLMWCSIAHDRRGCASTHRRGRRTGPKASPDASRACTNSSCSVSLEVLSTTAVQPLPSCSLQTSSG